MVVGGNVRPGRRFIGTSWKMNHTRSQTRAYLARLGSLLAPYPADLVVFVLPPYTSLCVAEELLAGGPVLYGAQDVHEEEAGAHTGDVSAEMLADLGCSFVEVGHSERRRDHHETDRQVGQKVRAIQRHGMMPLVCVGESGEEYGRGRAEECVTRQLQGAMEGAAASTLGRLLLAYEPWWAIGSGATAAPTDHVARVIDGIRNWIATSAGDATAIPILYGGSIDAENAAPLLGLPGVDGLFVGRAALDPEVFARIVQIGAGQLVDQDASTQPPLS
jgi:triosephosphate isomerase